MANLSLNIQESRLANGLVVLTDRMEGVRSGTLGFFYRVGSRHEPAELNGISHFIEHTVFKGSKRRSALDIAIETDRLGGNLDAFTSHEETGFAIKVIDDRLPDAFDLIADMLSSPLFDEADLRSERRVIIEEMKMTEDSPEELLGEIFSEAFFPGHPLGRNIAGTPETVRRFSHEVTRKYHEERFNASNLVIAAAGNVDHQRVLDLVQSAGLNHATASESKFESSPPKLEAPIVVRQNSNLEQAHLIIASPMVGAADPRRYAADMLAGILGGGTSSRLWQKVREERGLAYSVGASSSMHQDCGLFSVFAATSPEQAGEVLDLAIVEIKNVVRDGVTDDELDLAKDQTRASILLGLEDSAARAAALAQSEMVLGRQVSVDESIANFMAVTTDDLHELATEYFSTENIAFAALGALKGLAVTRGRLAI